MTDAPGLPDLLFTIAGAGTEYRLCLPHLLPAAMDPAAMLAAAHIALAQDVDAEPAEMLAAQSRAAFMLLCAGQPEAAQTILRRVIAAQTARGDAGQRYASELRLVQVLQQLGRTDEAVQLANEVAQRQSKCATGQHFALHHLGKALLQAGAHGEARAALSQALALRLALGKAELIASTRQALALLPPTVSGQHME